VLYFVHDQGGEEMEMMRVQGRQVFQMSWRSSGGRRGKSVNEWGCNEGGATMVEAIVSCVQYLYDEILRS
jgi:hypothetical protein